MRQSRKAVRRRAAALGLVLAATAATAATAASASAATVGLEASLDGGDVFADWTAASNDYELPAREPGSPAPTACSSPVMQQVFAMFEDDRDYFLAPGGAFERTPSGWSLGRAGVSYGNEPWYVRSKYDRSSLKIPAGETVTSAPVCVDLDHPTFRMFVRGSLVSDVTNTLQLTTPLHVEVVYADAAGTPSETVGRIDAGSKWQVTEDIPLLPELGGAEPGWRLVRFRFTASLDSVRIDDLYVDPRNSR